MIKVELINKEEIKNLFSNWGDFSRVCYNTDRKHIEKVGKHCFASGHFSGSRCEYFKFNISGISRACSLQLNRSSIGVVINQQSQRYVDMNNCEFVIPPNFKKNEKVMELYNNLMEQSKDTYNQIQQELIKDGKTKEQANEDARFSLLESCETTGMWGFTLEALINFMHKRLCSCSQWEIRQLAHLMRQEIIEVLPELKDSLTPICDYLTWCPEGEKRCCGRRPVK